MSANASPSGVNQALIVEIAVAADTRKILEVACTNVPKLSEEYVASLLKGQKMPDALVLAMKEIDRSVFSDMRKALVAGLQDLLKKYKGFDKERD